MHISITGLKPKGLWGFIRFWTLVIPLFGEAKSANGNTNWIESTLDSLIKCVEGKEIPKSGEDCDQCKYFETRMKFFHPQSTMQ